MIDINKLTEQDIGRSVRYVPFKGCDREQCEDGHITSWNELFIFVDYGNSCGRGIATKPEDLDISFPTFREKI